MTEQTPTALELEAADWVSFNKLVMKADKKQLERALKVEKKGKQRSSVTNRLVARLSEIAAQELKAKHT